MVFEHSRRFGALHKMQQTYYNSKITKYCIKIKTLNCHANTNRPSLLDIVKPGWSAQVDRHYDFVDDNGPDAVFWKNIEWVGKKQEVTKWLQGIC